MNEIIMSTKKLRKQFNGVTAVDGVDLEVRRGEVFGFLGPNGAGKTTTIGILLGLIHASSGEAFLFGERISPGHTAPLRRVGALVGAPTLLPYLSGRENLRLVARLHPDVDDARITAVLNQVKMSDAAARKVKGYSTGMKQRLGLAAALLHQPQLVILDEPTSGLDPAGMREMRELIRRLADNGTTIFLSSHLLHEVEQVCDRIAVINRGRIVAQGAVSSLMAPSAPELLLRIAEPERAAELLRAHPDVRGVQPNGNSLTVRGISGETAVALLAAHEMYPGELRPAAAAPDLEALFLSLTQEGSGNQV